jgi:hypothetical protein
MRRSLPAIALLAAGLSAAGLSVGPVAAAPLISFTDGSPGSGFTTSIGPELSYSAISWTQTVSASNLRFSAILASASAPGIGTTASWWLTDRIGPGTTAANVIASGSYTLLQSGLFGFDLSAAPYTVLFTGIDLPAGSYYLVVNGPTSQTPFFNTGFWYGDFQDVAANAAPGFSTSQPLLAGDFATQPLLPAFAPSAEFTAVASPESYVFFRLESDGPGEPVSEPATLALLGAGLLGLAAIRRRKA